MKALFILFVVMGTFRCAGNASIETENQNNGASNNSNGASISSGVKVKDGANALLGYITEGDQTTMTLLTTTGWFASIRIDGTDAVTTIYYSAAGCTGTPYYQVNSPVMYGKTLLYDGTSYFKPASVNANNIASAANQSYASQRNSSGCTAISNTQNTFTLTSATRTESGLPASITLPIQLEGQ